MKRANFERHLRLHNCVLVREGAKHSVYKNLNNGEMTVVGRHIDLYLPIVRKMCKDLGILPPKGK